MSEIGPVHHSPSTLGALGNRRAAPVELSAATPTRGDDTVELSEHSKLLGQLGNVPDVRTDLIAEARANIEAGVYDREEVIDATIDALAEDL